MDKILSFSVNKVYGVYNRNEWMKEVYESLTQLCDEDDIEVIQVYPAGWPRKVRVMIKETSVKESLYSSGINVFGQHVDLDDDHLGPPVIVTVTDAPIEMPFEKVTEMLQDYGKIVSVNDEFLAIEGRQTKLKTGTKTVKMVGVTKKIPEKVIVTDKFGRKTTVLLSCDRQYVQRMNIFEKKQFCKKCGSSSHLEEECKSNQKLCYRCGSESHLQFQCPIPKNTGVIENSEVYCFKGESAVLSNFNKQYPIVVNDESFNCNEQYIVHEKALLFGDDITAAEVMELTDPVKMKQLGNRIRNYNHKEWKEQSTKIVTKCNEIKFSTHPEALEVLMATEHKVLGEATSSKEWASGFAITHEKCLEYKEWQGENKMGKILMKIRENEHQRRNEQTRKKSDDRLSQSNTNEGKPVVNSQDTFYETVQFLDKLTDHGAHQDEQDKSNLTCTLVPRNN